MKLTFYKLGNTPYIVQRGDSVSKIAIRFNTTTKAIIEANKERYPSLLTNPNLIEIGWTFSIPTTANIPTTTTQVTSNSVNPVVKPKANNDTGFFNEFQKAFGTTGLIIGGLMLAGILIVSTKPKRR